MGGLSMSGALIMEIEHAMTASTGVLTDALGRAVELEQSIDLLLGATGNSTEKAIDMHLKGRTVRADHDLVVLKAIELGSAVSNDTVEELDEEMNDDAKEHDKNLAVDKEESALGEEEAAEEEAQEKEEEEQAEKKKQKKEAKEKKKEEKEKAKEEKKKEKEE